MKSSYILILAVFLASFSCNKEFDHINDYRKEVTGQYSGIRVDTYWVDSVVGYVHDTTTVTIDLVPTIDDSSVAIYFTPEYLTEIFSFHFANGNFQPTTNYHPPLLTVATDSLYFKHQPSLGPQWTEFFALRN